MFCERLLALDSSITYVGIADRFGSLITGAYRSVPFPDEKEAEQYSVQTTLSALIMEHFESRAGLECRDYVAQTGDESCYTKWIA